MSLSSRFVPVFFEKGFGEGVGWVELTEAGRKALEDELAEPSTFPLEAPTGKIAA